MLHVRREAAALTALQVASVRCTLQVSHCMLRARPHAPKMHACACLLGSVGGGAAARSACPILWLPGCSKQIFPSLSQWLSVLQVPSAWFVVGVATVMLSVFMYQRATPQVLGLVCDCRNQGRLRTPWHVYALLCWSYALHNYRVACCM